jgi:hypothetical protein
MNWANITKGADGCQQKKRPCSARNYSGLPPGTGAKSAPWPKRPT